MAGGTGSRLWPLSRKLFPKQFLKIASNNTMIQETLLRLKGLDIDTPITICNEEHRFIVAEQLREIEQMGSIILEPFGRNTAPAIALAAFNEVNAGNDPIMLILAADHVIADAQTFQQTIMNSVPLANDGQLVTFGIVPTHAETGYGYIKRGQANANAFTVDSFVEKPKVDIAEQYLASGEYYWNSGMFMFKASRYLEELKKFNSEIYDACQASLAQTTPDMDFIRIDADAFAKCPDDSIDYAVMEKTKETVVVPLAANWSDIGSFSAIWDIKEKDENGNVLQGDVLIQGCKNNLVIAGNKLVATVGMENTIVVQTKDAILVANKDKVQDVKKIVAQLKQAQRSEANLHRQVYRPWGHYDSIDFGRRDQVKRITVKPGEKLSIQMHHHRSEHWVVVSGTAKVTNGEETFLVRENESTYIPIGQVHALENPGILPLELIEVQVGDYLGEDDIVRFEDRYGRS